MNIDVNKHKIVLVDDESIITSALKNLLEQEENYTPTIFNCPVEALDYIKNNSCDLVISDFLMPEMNGIELLKQVKSINSSITLILLTGYADKNNAISAINEVGLYKYIEKPWDNDDLLLNIKNGLERKHLLESIKEKVEEIVKAKQQLQEYNEKLEFTVKERTRELEESNKKLDSIIKYCADGIITISNDGEICNINPALERIFKKDKSQVIGKNFSDFFINENGNSITSELNPNLDVLTKDYSLITKNGKANIPIEISFAPIVQFESSEVTNYVGVVRSNGDLKKVY